MRYFFLGFLVCVGIGLTLALVGLVKHLRREGRWQRLVLFGQANGLTYRRRRPRGRDPVQLDVTGASTPDRTPVTASGEWRPLRSSRVG